MNKQKEKEELKLIPSCEKYIQYMLEILFKLPRIEKFNIGNEYKKLMYETLENIHYLQKIHISKWLYYLNKIDALLNIQRSLLRIMYKNRWIDCKKFNNAIALIAEIGKIIGGLIKYYAQNNKKSIL